MKKLGSGVGRKKRDDEGYVAVFCSDPSRAIRLLETGRSAGG